MAEHRETIEYLCDEVGARPTGTEEEQLAALYIAEKLREKTGLNAIVEDFNCLSNPSIIKIICFGLGIVSAILSIILPSLCFVWAILTILAALIYVLEGKGKNILSRFFKNGISQNVVAKYEPEGKSPARRKIVLVANYDSGKDLNGASKGFIVDHVVQLQWACLGGLAASAFFLLIHALFFTSTTGVVVGVFNFFSVICILLMAIPLVGIILEQRAPFSQGANNNAASVSVLLELAQAVSEGALADEESEDVEILGEEEARKAGAIPEGAEIEYETQSRRNLTPEESLAAAKAAIAAMTGKPVADKVPFTDITSHLVHGDGFDEYNQPVDVHFEVADEPAEIQRQNYFGEADYAQVAAEEERSFKPAQRRVIVSADMEGTEAETLQAEGAAIEADAQADQFVDENGQATAQATAQGSAAPMSESQAAPAEYGQNKFVRQNPADVIQGTGEVIDAVAAPQDESIPAWARSAQAKARANRPDLANVKPNVSRSRFADTVAAQITDAAIESNKTNPFKAVVPQTELQQRIEELREDIETAAAYADPNVQGDAQDGQAGMPTDAQAQATQVAGADAQPAQGAAQAEGAGFAQGAAGEAGVSAAAGVAGEFATVDTPGATDATAPISDAPLAQEISEAEGAAQDQDNASEPAGRGKKVAKPAVVIPSISNDINEQDTQPFDEVTDEALEEYASQASAEEGAESQTADNFENYDTDSEEVARPSRQRGNRPVRRQSVRATEEASGIGAIAGKATSLLSGFGGSLKKKVPSLSFGKKNQDDFAPEMFEDEHYEEQIPEPAKQPQVVSLHQSKASQIPAGGPIVDVEEELIEEQEQLGATSSFAPMDVSAFLNDVEDDGFDEYDEYAQQNDFDDYDEYYDQDFDDVVEEIDIQEEVARKIEAAQTDSMSVEDITRAVKAEMDAERHQRTVNQAVQVAQASVLNLPSITGSFSAVNNQGAVPSALVSSMIPRITSDGTPDLEGVAKVAQFNNAPAPTSVPAPVEPKKSETPLFPLDVEREMQQANQEEEFVSFGEGDFPAPTVDEPKKGFFSRFKRNKKKEEDSGFAQWVGADENYVAQEVGKQRGSWESFQQQEPVDDLGKTQQGFAPIDFQNSQPQPGTMAGGDMQTDDGFIPVDFSNSSFKNPRDWNGGGLSLDRLKEMKNNSANRLFKKDEASPEMQPPRESRRSATRSRRSTSNYVQPSGVELGENGEEMEQIYRFKNGGIDAEIWFVALGSTLPNNEGMKAFLDTHESELKGATIINLEALGAGSLSFVQHEGRYKGVNATSRFKRFLRQASELSGISFSTGRLEGIDTPATEAIKRGYQAASLMGMKGGKKALIASADDVMENLDEQTLQDNTNFILALLKSL
ncbi:MAG: hypothetical protein ACI4BI_04665 [Anaerotardibacter sp.]